MKEMISLEEAQRTILNLAKPLEMAEPELLRALGRVLAKDIVVTGPLPPFTRSRMDGYAIRAADSTGATADKPSPLHVIEQVYAGNKATKQITIGTACRITTGAPLPLGADCVVRCEDTYSKNDYVYICKDHGVNENISQAGDDFAPGEVALPAGRIVDPSAVLLLAALGFAKVPVHRAPTVAVCATGDELLPLGEQLDPGKIYASNLYAIAASVSESGAQVALMERAADNLEQITEKIMKCLDLADLLVVTGGGGAGEKDLVSKAMGLTGAELLFHRIACRPGRSVSCSFRSDKLIIGLSGSPAAAMTMFNLLVRPVLLRMSGHRQFFLQRVKARLVSNIADSGRQRRFVPAFSYWLEEYQVRPDNVHTHGAIKSLVANNALIDIPAGQGYLPAGSLVEVLLL